jgi:hypothetical protein
VLFFFHRVKLGMHVCGCKKFEQSQTKTHCLGLAKSKSRNLTFISVSYMLFTLHLIC